MPKALTARAHVTAIALISLVPALHAQAPLPAVAATPSAQLVEVLPGFDPSTPLGSRITSPPDRELQHFHDSVGSTVTVHELTVAERMSVESSLQQLPVFARQALMDHVRSISFLEGLAGNATTMKEEGSAGAVFNVVLRAGLLDETVSQFLTRKERNCYSDSNSGETISVEAGSLPAILYVLLHESVHVVDISNRAGRAGPPQLFRNGSLSQLVQGIWSDPTTPVPAYRSSLFEFSRFRTGKPENIDLAEPTYQALARTPFVSLYGSSNWYDDVAELVACYYFTQRLHQPYRIVLHKGTDILYSLDPMNSKLVISRFASIENLFA